MQDGGWGRDDPTEGLEIIEELDLNTGGLVGAVTSIEGTGQLITGTRNDESGWDQALLGRGKNSPAAAAPQDNRLTVHTIRDTSGRVLGLGSCPQAGGEGVGDDDDDEVGGGGGWEPVVEAWASHEGAVTGIDVAGGFANLGGVSGVVTSGGDGCLRVFELTAGDDQYDEGRDQDQYDNGDGSPAAGGPSLALRAQVAAHTARATGVAATRRRAVTVGEDGVASLVDLQRLSSGGGGGGGGGRDGGVVWARSAKGALPLSGVTFQGESEEVFATVGCDPRAQLQVWDTRADASRPAWTPHGRFDDSDAPYLCVASQPFTPQTFACGVSTGEILLWDVRTGQMLHELAEGGSQSYTGGGTWGVTFHPRRPRHLFSCSGSGLLTKWLLPAEQAQGAAAVAPRFGFGGGGGGGGRSLHALPSRSALVGVCYDEAADCLSAVSKHGHVVVAQGVAGLRL